MESFFCAFLDDVKEFNACRIEVFDFEASMEEDIKLCDSRVKCYLDKADRIDQRTSNRTSEHMSARRCSNALRQRAAKLSLRSAKLKADLPVLKLEVHARLKRRQQVQILYFISMHLSRS